MAGPASLSDHVGRVLNGRYRLIAPIGTGASGHVFAAEDVVLGRRVAIKLLHPALQADEAFLGRFRAEARSAAALSHPNIVAVYDWGEGDEPYLVLEYLAGGSLRDLLDTGQRLSPAQAAAVGAEVASALAYAHRRGVVHRDVKPANLLFDEEGRSRVADFGLARALAEAAWTEPLGGLVGTVRYASPEQADGGEVDGRADVYALALVLVEAMTGAVPFVASTALATLMARIGRDLEVPEATGPLAGVLAAAGRARASERLASGEMAARLEQVAMSLPPPAPLPAVAPRADGGVAMAGRTLAGPAVDAVMAPSSGGTPDPTLVGPPDAQVEPPPWGAVPAWAPPDGPPGLADGAASGRGGPPAHRARRRHRRWLLATAVLFVLLAAGGVAYGIHVATLPTYRLPALRGDSVSGARATLAGHLRLVVASHHYDAAVPAGQIAGQSPTAGTMVREGSAVSVVLSKGPAPRPVPSLKGDDDVTATQALSRSGFRYQEEPQYSETVPAGQVISWSPTGMQAYNTLVTLVISKGPVPRTVPHLGQGQTYEQAAVKLRALGLYAQREDVYNDTVAAGYVVGTTPGAGATVPRGSTVTVQVSDGPQLVTVPDVTTESVAMATSVLQGQGLKVGKVSGSSKKPVISTSPAAGAQVPTGSSVSLTTGSSAKSNGSSGQGGG